MLIRGPDGILGLVHQNTLTEFFQLVPTDRRDNGPKPLEKLHFYQCDHLGTPMMVTDELGNIAWSARYQAFVMATVDGPSHGSPGKVRNDIRFQGHYFDRETGFHYNRHRYYGPSIRRYISRDPIGFAGGTHGYSYVGNSSTAMTDPMGLDPHFYKSRVFRCMGNCTDQSMRELKCNPAPGVVLGEELQNGAVNTVGIGPKILVKIATTIDEENKQITNATLPDHMLYPG